MTTRPMATPSPANCCARSPVQAYREHCHGHHLRRRGSCHCDYRKLATALLEAHRGAEPLVDRSELHATGPRGSRQTWFVLPARQPGVAMGAKLVSVMPTNPRLHPEIPAVQALYVLFDGTDGSLLAIIDATAMTYRKTAADSALGC